MAKVYLGIGTNLGDREANVCQVVKELETAKINVLKISKIIATKPYGVLDQPDFLNAVCLVATELEPNALLKLLKSIEKKMGREQTKRWGPRVIDLDIILYEDRIINQENLMIPHADMLNRLFVLQSLAELAPDLLHPVSKKTIKEHLSELERESQQEMLK